MKLEVTLYSEIAIIKVVAALTNDNLPTLIDEIKKLANRGRPWIIIDVFDTNMTKDVGSELTFTKPKMTHHAIRKFLFVSKLTGLTDGTDLDDVLKRCPSKTSAQLREWISIQNQMKELNATRERLEKVAKSVSDPEKQKSIWTYENRFLKHWRETLDELLKRLEANAKLVKYEENPENQKVLATWTELKKRAQAHVRTALFP